MIYQLFFLYREQRICNSKQITKKPRLYKLDIEMCRRDERMKKTKIHKSLCFSGFNETLGGAIAKICRVKISFLLA